MGKAKSSYTIEEAAELLGVTPTNVLILLAAIRPSVDPKQVKKIKTSELERLYRMLKKE